MLESNLVTSPIQGLHIELDLINTCSEANHLNSPLHGEVRVFFLALLTMIRGSLSLDENKQMK
jgi:hypothetical protein